MSTRKPTKKKVVVTTSKKDSPAPKKKGSVKASKAKIGSLNKKSQEPLLFGKRHYIFMSIGVGLIALGMILMSGGSMPSPDVWDEGIIYSFQRTVLAPILILGGLIMEIYVLFMND